MSRLRSTLVVVGAAAAVAVPSASAATPAKLVGTVGPSITIGITQGGKPVTKLKAGTYLLTVNDKSRAHTFFLETMKGTKIVTMPITTAPFVGVKKVTLKLTPGKYLVYCNLHLNFMKSEFSVS